MGKRDLSFKLTDLKGSVLFILRWIGTGPIRTWLCQNLDALLVNTRRPLAHLVSKAWPAELIDRLGPLAHLVSKAWPAELIDRLGPLAHLVERPVCIREVAGSSPARSTREARCPFDSRSAENKGPFGTMHGESGTVHKAICF